MKIKKKNAFGCIRSQLWHSVSSLCHVGSFIVAHGFPSSGTRAQQLRPQWLWHVGSLVVAHGLRCSTAREILVPPSGINNLRYADDTTLMAESKEGLKSLLMKVKEESEKASLKLNIQKNKIMTSGPITSWEIDGKIVETVSDFIFLGSRITADGDCSHEIKRRLFLGRKVMTNLDSILKSRDSTLPTKVGLIKALVFPLVMYGCESWTIKKAEH